MPINTLKITHFRNLKALDIEFNPKITAIYGENGSGKTSILEAIFLLAYGRSFRTSTLSRLINRDADELQLFAAVTDFEAKQHQIGLSRSLDAQKTLRMDGKTLHSIAEVSELLPVQFIGVDSYRYFHDGPKVRRHFLDWGVFHVKHSFLKLSRDYDRVLKQRNAALKAHVPRSEISSWNELIVPLAEKIHEERLAYIDQLCPILEEYLQKFLPAYSLELKYLPGWEENYAAALDNCYIKDAQLGYTSIGAHRADLQLMTSNVAVDDVLSQGQQKLAVYALKLAQGKLQQNLTSNPSIFLIDDLPSELDQNNQAVIHELVEQLDSQVILTGINASDMLKVKGVTESELFHVKQSVVLHETPN